MNTPKLYNIENTECYLAKEIYNFDRGYFVGISSVRMREIIIKKKLQPDEYLFGLEVSNGTILKKDQSLRKSQLYLTKEYVDNNVPKFKNTIDKTDYKYEISPEILYLTDEEKFKDTNNNIIDIEVRGDERKHNKCYFKMEDISKGFEIPRLYDSLIEKTGRYENNIHYKYFSIVDKTKIDDKLNNTTTIQKKLFLTYKGVLKVLFSSRTGNAENFQDWVCEKLFTIQMGDEEDKIKLSSKMIGMSMKALKNLLGTNSYDKTPCVYLFLIEQANTLLKTDKYKENDIVCKFGFTKDLKQRFTDHQQHYTKLFNDKDLKLELITFGIIDIFNLSKAESRLKLLFEDKKLEYGNEQELIILDKTKLNKIKEHYTMIQKVYIGSYQELYDQINESKQQLKDKDNVLKDKDNEIILLKEIHSRELLEEKNKLILINKEIELLNIKNENKLLIYKVKLLENGIKLD
jgi:hypothetical protein